MDRRDLDEIERFLTSVGRPTLFAYYGLGTETPALGADDAVKKRRSWAQGQQSNPKYKSEALFLIKNNGLLRRVFVEQLEEYREHVRDDTANRNLDVLTLFIRGTLTSGTLSTQAEAAILHQGRQLELSDVAVARRIEELLVETGATREGVAPDDVTAEAMSVDHYGALGVAFDAPPAAIEEAYRSRYRWARNLKDLKRSADILRELDEAWRMLSDPKRRARYDERRLEVVEATDEVEKRAATLLGLLAGPEDTAARAPFTPPPPIDTPVHEIGFRPSISVPSPPVDSARGEGPRAPAPPPVAGRTIGIGSGPQPVGGLGPRLTIDGPDSINLTVGARPFQRTLTIRNTGVGKMPGRVVSDRDWLRIPQARLDPTVGEQQVPLHFEPSQMPWGRSGGTITVVTDHGERRTITFNVTRRSRTPLIVALVGVCGVIAALLFTAAVLWSTGPTPHAHGSLTLSIDPLADRIFVDGKPAGGGAVAQIEEPVPGRPFKLRVEADGFVAQEDIVALKDGEHASRSIRLELADEPTWVEPKEAPISLGAAGQAAVAEARTGLGACFAGIGGVTEAVAIYTAMVTADGEVRRVDVTVPNFALEPVEPCIRRVFRGLRLPPFAAGHAVVETRIAVPVVR